MSEWIGSPIRGAAAALLALALVPEPAAATSPTAVDPARGLTEDFEAATVVEGAVSAPGLSVRPMRPDEAFPDRPRGAVASGGALSIMDVGAALGAAYGAVRGRAVSTRDLSIAYGFVIALERSAASVAAARAAGDAPWSLRAYDRGGALLTAAVLAPDAVGFRLEAPEPALAGGRGIARVDVLSLDGWDWALLDGFETAPVPAALAEAGAGSAEVAMATTPPPAGAALLIVSLVIAGLQPRPSPPPRRDDPLDSRSGPVAPDGRTLSTWVVPRP